MNRRSLSGLTLVELLVVVAIFAILGAISLPVISSLQERARATNEISGARQTIAAWISYAGDRDGQVLPGYQSEPGVTNAEGETLRFPVNARYVFRLAPYLDYRLQGTVLVNDQSRLKDDYAISTSPTFGINLTFVGGDFGGGSDLRPTATNLATYGKFVVTRIAGIHAPSKLIVFASARFDRPDGHVVEGYNAIRSPSLHARRWPERYDVGEPWYTYGMVHLRYDEKAVCAMADGHVELLDFEQLQDMRRWSNQAAEADDPDWTLTSTGQASL